MNISIYYDKEGIKQILVLGELDTQEKINTFLESTEERKNVPISITFFDAGILHRDIVVRLFHLQKFNLLKVFVLKSYLYSYLYRLGIRCRYISNKTVLNKSEIKNTITKNNELEKDDVINFLEDIYRCYGYDYTQYQIESIIRRIKICMLRENAKDFDQFKYSVLNNEDVFEELFLHFSINTTEFFRDPEIFAEVRKKIFPYLDSFPHIKIWCCGCSTGQEPYSLAIVLQELGMLHKAQIYATDMNPFVIEEAKNGLYPLGKLQEHIDNYRKANGQKSFMDYFEIKEGYLEVSPKLKKNILFFQHSLGGDGILNEFHLIFCRNVLIYFRPNLQKHILENFHHSLERNGFVVLGKSEGIQYNEGYYFFYSISPRNKIFKKKEIDRMI